MQKDKTKNYTAAKCLHLFRKHSDGWNQEKWLSYYCQEELRGPYSIVWMINFVVQLQITSWYLIIYHQEGLELET
jgi:hypothetical protein